MTEERQQRTLRFTWRGGRWRITDPRTPDDIGVPVDSALVAMTSRRGDIIEGYAVSVHGLPAGVADCMPTEQLRRLGVGPRTVAMPRGTQRVHLGAGGVVESW